jgi:hypothetical protein
MPERPRSTWYVITANSAGSFMMRTRPSLALAILSAMLAVGCTAERDASGEIQSAGSLDAFQMRAGDCFDDSFFDAGEISDVPGVPCSEPHDNEVYALFDIQGNVFPGDDNVEELADAGCLDRFEAAIGMSYQESVIDYTTMYPSQGSWDERGDREVICVAYHMELEKLEGTVIGSGR